jgi:hypothetical protein
MKPIYDLVNRASRSRTVGLVLLTAGLSLFVAAIIASIAYPEPYLVPKFLKYCLDDRADGRHLTEGCQNVRFLVVRDLGNPTLVDLIQAARWLPVASMVAGFAGLGVTLVSQAKGSSSPDR